MENRNINKLKIQLQIVIATISIVIAISTLFIDGFLLVKSSKCKFDIESTKSNIVNLNGSGNFSILTDAIIAEAEGDYMNCLSKDNGIFTKNKNAEESLKKYEEAQALYDSLRVENNNIKARIDKLQFELSRLQKQLIDELEGNNSKAGYGPKALELKRQSEKYQLEINVLQKDYSEFEKTYLDNMLRIKSKIIELK